MTRIIDIIFKRVIDIIDKNMREINFMPAMVITVHIAI